MELGEPAPVIAETSGARLWLALRRAMSELLVNGIVSGSLNLQLEKAL